MTGTGEFLAPDYGRRSLCDVLPAVARALGTPLSGRHDSGPDLGLDPGLDPGLDLGAPALVLPDAPSYVVFLVDGMGARLLQRHAHAAPFLASLMQGEHTGTAGVPSTTATSLTSLGTAMPPGSHGLVGFTARIPGTDRLLNHLMWDPRVDPLEWQPHPTAFGRLASAGVEVTSVNKRDFARSALTVASQRGASYVGADRIGERIAGAVTAASGTPSLTYVYDGDLDWTGHRFGVASTQWLQQLVMIDAQAEQLREALPASSRLVVVADHGMVDSPQEARIDVDEVHELRDGVTLLGGEARFRHVYCTAGAAPDVVATWREVLGDRGVVLSREEAVATGWFGDVATAVLPRLGDVVVACRGEAAVVSSVDFPYEQTLIGLHGSLTPAEMSIPILVA